MTKKSNREVVQRKVVTPRELAEHLRVAEGTVLRWAREGQIPKLQIAGRAVRFVLDDVVDTLASAGE